MINQRVVSFLILCVCWLALSGRDDYFLMGIGAVSAFFVVIISARLNLDKPAIWLNYLNYRCFFYILYLIKEILASSIYVLRKIWARNIRIQPQFFWHKMYAEDEVGRTIYSNSITLTPGTISVMGSKDKFYVHALTNSTKKSLESDEMNLKIKNIREE